MVGRAEGIKTNGFPEKMIRECEMSRVPLGILPFHLAFFGNFVAWQKRNEGFEYEGKKR